MSLPAVQQRVLDGMERALQASEPHMASMYAIFARLHEGTEPTGAEPLKRRRWRGPQSGTGQSGRGMYAMALIPVMFIIVVAGVLLGGSAHGLTTCGSGSAAFGGSPCAAGLLIKLPDGTCNIHPSPAGHLLLAQAIEDVAGAHAPK